MLSGLRSRCTIPAACACARASATLLADLGRPLPGQPAETGDLGAERRAGNEPHDDPRCVVVLDHVVDGDHAGVVQPGGGPRLAHRAGEETGPLRGRLGQQQDLLDRHFPFKKLVTGTPDPAHAALAHRLGQQVASRDQNPHPTWHATILGRNGKCRSQPQPF
jgi:hypothetical protein